MSTYPAVLSYSFKLDCLLSSLFRLQRCIVLDIEGTTTPISFVSEVLFPYARDNVGRHLSATYDTSETKADIKLLHSQVRFYLAVWLRYLYSSSCWMYVSS